MLVLTRKIDETIVLAGGIEITVVEIRGDTVKLGIVAPPEVKVYRAEVFKAIQEENRLAAANIPAKLPDLRLD